MLAWLIFPTENNNAGKEKEKTNRNSKRWTVWRAEIPPNGM